MITSGDQRSASQGKFAGQDTSASIRQKDRPRADMNESCGSVALDDAGAARKSMRGAGRRDGDDRKVKRVAK